MAIIGFVDRGWDIDGAAIAYVKYDQVRSFDGVGMLSGGIARSLPVLGLPKGSNCAAKYHQPHAAHADAMACLRNRSR